LGLNAKPLVRRLCPMHETRRPAFQWWRGHDLNVRPSGYEPDELPDCSTPRSHLNGITGERQTRACEGGPLRRTRFLSFLLFYFRGQLAGAFRVDTTRRAAQLPCGDP